METTVEEDKEQIKVRVCACVCALSYIKFENTNCGCMRAYCTLCESILTVYSPRASPMTGRLSRSPFGQKDASIVETVREITTAPE